MNILPFEASSETWPSQLLGKDQVLGLSIPSASKMDFSGHYSSTNSEKLPTYFGNQSNQNCGFHGNFLSPNGMGQTLPLEPHNQMTSTCQFDLQNYSPPASSCEAPNLLLSGFPEDGYGFWPQEAFFPEGNGKRKRKRIITVEQRRAANVRERKRMFQLNESFDLLRKRVPTFAYEKKLSRIETLRLAVTYIEFMTDLLKNNGKEEESPRKRAKKEPKFSNEDCSSSEECQKSEFFLENDSSTEEEDSL